MCSKMALVAIVTTLVMNTNLIEKKLDQLIP